MKQFFSILLFLFFVSFSQAQSKNNLNQQEKNLPNRSIHLKIYVDSNSDIFVDGKKVSFKKFEKELKKFKKKNGVIHYSRTFSGQENDNKNKEVISAITKHRFPIQFYTDNTFSKVAEW